jgi:sugar O-acyltransferase (sialic acid O-acetyltransferase NeuD family)
MIIAGAGGHAIEILDDYLLNKDSTERLVFFDDINGKKVLFDKYGVLGELRELLDYFDKDKRFVLGVGSPKGRREFAKKLKSHGGQLTSFISIQSTIGLNNVKLEIGVNIMAGARISSNVVIGEGTLVNRNASIHHDCTIGDYCEISPNCTILGGVRLGNNCFVGSGAVILPNVQIGDNVIIGAGAVVTKDYHGNQTLIGVPAKPKISTQ